MGAKFTAANQLEKGVDCSQEVFWAGIRRRLQLKYDGTR